MEKKKRKRIQRKGFPGYPHYPEGEDIFNRNKIETELDPEQPGKIKAADATPEQPDELNFAEDVSTTDPEIPGADLDIPGAELDDTQEEIGSEDEENNYYSLGGDDKEALEEGKG